MSKLFMKNYLRLSEGIYLPSGTTFMKEYRKYASCGQAKYRPDLDEYTLCRWGIRLAILFARYDRIVHRLGTTNIHTRINYRSYAAKSPDWNVRHKGLVLMWRLFEVKK